MGSALCACRQRRRAWEPCKLHRSKRHSARSLRRHARRRCGAQRKGPPRRRREGFSADGECGPRWGPHSVRAGNVDALGNPVNCIVPRDIRRAPFGGMHAAAAGLRGRGLPEGGGRVFRQTESADPDEVRTLFFLLVLGDSHVEARVVLVVDVGPVAEHDAQGGRVVLVDAEEELLLRHEVPGDVQQQAQGLRGVAPAAKGATDEVAEVAGALRRARA